MKTLLLPGPQFLIYKLLGMGLDYCKIPSSFTILRIKVAVHARWVEWFLTYLVTKKEFLMVRKFNIIVQI